MWSNHIRYLNKSPKMHAVADYNQKLMDKRRHEIPKLAGKNL